jgi:hypothetical protein
MSEFLPVKSIYTGSDVTALGEASPTDVMLAPGGGIKFPDGSIQIKAPADGTQGPAGPEGPQGIQGEAGPAGADGSAGPQGPAGADGAVGPQGPAGADGVDGAEGLSAYEVAVTNGYPGTEAEWVASLEGPAGADGAAGPQGNQGEVGPQGPAGADGPAGPKGDTGETGPAGADSTVPGPKGDTGETGPAGADGAAGPKGDTGDTGPAGADGAQGPKGDTGPAGADGAAGPKGDPGETGPAGADGAAGPKGDTGETGPAGADGAQGPAGADGVVGPKGDTGDTGPAGADGAQGPAGPAGADSTVPGPKGDTGPAGADGAAGPQGIQGEVGPAGPAGADGAQGPAGPAGADSTVPGPQGPAGADGAAGPQGIQGEVGAQGPAGADGAVGPQGPAGADGAPGAQGIQGEVGPAGPAGADSTVPGPAGPQGEIGPEGPPTGALVEEAPPTADPKALWFDSDAGRMYLKYVNPDAREVWVEANVSGAATPDLSNYVQKSGDTMTGALTVPNFAYTGTLTGGTGIIDIGSGQIYKAANGYIGIGTKTPVAQVNIQAPAYTSGVTKTLFSSVEWGAIKAEAFACGIDGTTITGKAGEILEGGVLKAAGIIGYYQPSNPSPLAKTAVYGRSYDPNFLAGSFVGKVGVEGNIEMPGPDSGIRYRGVGVTQPDLMSNVIAIGWTGSAIQFRVDSSLMPGGTLSDSRIKTNVSPASGLLEKVLQLNPVFYSYSATRAKSIASVVLDSSDHLGFIAQEVELLIPEAVTHADPEDADSLRGLDAIPLISALVAAMKEQQALIQDLTTRLTALENK